MSDVVLSERFKVVNWHRATGQLSGSDAIKSLTIGAIKSNTTETSSFFFGSQTLMRPTSGFRTIDRRDASERPRRRTCEREQYGNIGGPKSSQTGRRHPNGLRFYATDKAVPTLVLNHLAKSISSPEKVASGETLSPRPWAACGTLVKAA